MRCPRCHRRLRAGAACRQHGWAVPTEPAAPPPSPPATPPAWPIRGLVATGGSSLVFETVAPGGGRAVLKMARWRDADLRHRFADEARLLRSLGPPAVPALLDHGEHEGWPYLALEHLGDETLAGRLLDHPDGLPMRDAIAILAGLTDSVATLHDAGILHGDLKPENAFTAAGRMRLIDLGGARSIGSGDASATAGVIGTIYYQAPEQLRGDRVDARSDVYAIAAIGFELLTGRPPFGGERPAIEYGHLMCRPPRVTSLRQVPAELDDLIDEGLAKTPARRPTLAELARRLRSSRTVSAPAVSAPAAHVRHADGPVALLWIDGAAPIDAVRAVERTRGIVAGRRRGGLLAVYTWHDHDRPLAAALEAAQSLDGRSMIAHVATAAVGRGQGDRVVVTGDVVADPATWLPTAPWSALALTGAAAAELPDGSTERAGEVAGFFQLVRRDRTDAAGGEPPLYGRQPLVDDLAAAARRAVEDGAPALVTVVGESGIGTSRVLLELRRRLPAGVPTILLAGRRRLGGSSGLAEELAARFGGGVLRDALRTAADRGTIIVLDDGQWSDDVVLDAIETAAGWPGARFAAIIGATEQLLRGRPTWGSRAAAHTLVRLPPLDDDDAERLLRHLIAPVTRIPIALVERLVERGGGNPAVLVGIVRELKRAGLIRRHPDSDEWYVAADELEQIPMHPGARWLTAQRLGALPPGVRPLVETCAVIGPRFDLRELEHVAPAGHVADTPAVDPEAGVGFLVHAGLLRRADVGLELAGATHETIYEQVDEPRRRAIHAAAFAHWRDRVDADPAERLRRLGHHGGRCGEDVIAATAWLALARDARVRHAHLEAERLLTAALDVLDAAPSRLRAEALAERGRARRMLTHYEAARDDVRTARGLAETLGEIDLVVDLLVADAAICDFTERLSESAELVERAAALAPATLAPAVRARLLNWSGVVRARQERLDDAVRELNLAIALADSLDDRETVTGSMLMLGGVLRRLDRIDDGLRVLDDVIARCERDDDHFHLTVGLFNRINVWRRIGRPDRAERDCERAIGVAERHGLGQLEVWGWHNLAELRWCTGNLPGALEAAERSHELGRRRFRERPPIVGTLQLAFLAAGVGEHDRARAHIATIADEDVRSSPSLALLADAIAAALGAAPTAVWDELLTRSRRTGGEEDALFVLWLRASCERRLGRAAEAEVTERSGREELTRHQLQPPGPFAAG